MTRRTNKTHRSSTINVDELLPHAVTSHVKPMLQNLERQMSLATKPLVARVPSKVQIAGYRILSANLFALARLFFMIPFTLCLISGIYSGCFAVMLLHEFATHFDAAVAEYHTKRRKKNESRSARNLQSGSLLNALCTKFVTIYALWSILLFTNYTSMNPWLMLAFLGICAAVFVYETLIGSVRLEDYYFHTFASLPVHNSAADGLLCQVSLSEARLKQKMQSLGVAFLCLAMPDVLTSFNNYSGLAGLACLALCLPFAHASLAHKLIARKIRNDRAKTLELCTAPNPASPVLSHESDASSDDDEENPSMVDDEPLPMPPADGSSSSSSSSVGDDEGEEVRPKKKTYVYSVGCFDLLHRGHEVLFQRMRKYGEKLIIGVHDDESIFKLKNKYPIDNTETRISNVAKYADHVFVIAGTDPTPYLNAIIDKKHPEEAIYVRGQDMPNFPGRQLIEGLGIEIFLLPYTQGVSSTQLRNELLAADPELRERQLRREGKV